MTAKGVVFVITETDDRGEVNNVLVYEKMADAVAALVRMAKPAGNDTGYRELQSGLLVSSFTSDEFAEDIVPVLEEAGAYAVGNEDWEIQLTCADLL